MADRKPPKITVEVEDESGAQAGAAFGSAASGKAKASGKKTHAKDVHRTIVAWIETRFPGHGNAIFFGLVGLAAAILIFSLGFWRTLLIAVLVVAGVAFGQYLDGDPRIVNVFRRLLGPSDNN
jgi:uncharacterized membrane protein